jgi:hypothetical protein
VSFGGLERRRNSLVESGKGLVCFDYNSASF